MSNTPLNTRTVLRSIHQCDSCMYPLLENYDSCPMCNTVYCKSATTPKSDIIPILSELTLKRINDEIHISVPKDTPLQIIIDTKYVDFDINRITVMDKDRNVINPKTT